jgi:hypothetical protein
MAASASTGVAEVAVVHHSMASLIRRELATGKYQSGAEIDPDTLAKKRSQLAAFVAANEGKRPRAAKWSSMLRSTVKVDGNTTRALVTREAVETRTAVALVAEDARTGRAAAVNALDLLMGKDVGRRPEQTAKERLKECRSLKTALNNECLELCEEEAVRKRDLLGETPAARASREAREQTAATRTENTSAAREEKAEKRKADALEKKEEKAAKRKAAVLEKKAKRTEAGSGRASSSTTPRPKPGAKAESKATGNPVATFFKMQTQLTDFADGVAEHLDKDDASDTPTGPQQTQLADFADGVAEHLDKDDASDTPTGPVPYSQELKDEAIKCQQDCKDAGLEMQRLRRSIDCGETRREIIQAKSALKEVEKSHTGFMNRGIELAAAGYTPAQSAGDESEYSSEA